jgi:hypothetical protein
MPAGRHCTGRSDVCNSAYRFLWTDSGLRRPCGSRGRMLPIRTIRPKPDSHSKHPACPADQEGAPPFSGYNASSVLHALVGGVVRLHVWRLNNELRDARGGYVSHATNSRRE